jgi:signal transduction histidine kinase
VYDQTSSSSTVTVAIGGVAAAVAIALARADRSLAGALLVFDDLRRGLGALSALSGDLQRAGQQEEVLDVLLARPLALPGVNGSALYRVDDSEPRFVRGAGVCASWEGGSIPAGPRAVLREVIQSGRPQFTRNWPDPSQDTEYAFAAALPILQNERVIAALVILGRARDPFTALDDRFLLALGHQVGAALEHADLYRRLETRSHELLRLSQRMVQQHEDERRRLSRELHDETAQVFSAVKMELGILRKELPRHQLQRLDQVLELIDTGIRSIRNVTNDLRPSLLDDLGLLPALRSLVSEFSDRSGIRATLDAPSVLPSLSPEAELALFRALQEALSNVLRHAAAQTVLVNLSSSSQGVLLRVSDDGRGFPAGMDPARMDLNGHMGLTGMRERITTLGGSMRLARNNGAGVVLEVLVPTPAGSPG